MRTIEQTIEEEQRSARRFAHRACPICGALPRKLLFRQAFEQLSVARLMDGYDVVVCGECGAGFADYIPPQAVFDAYYRDLSKYEDGRIDAGPQPVEQRLLDTGTVIESFIPSKDARVLEVGCASGGLLKAIMDRGFHNLLGVDPSPGCVCAAREFYGIPAIAATLFTVPEPEIPYDFLILTGVLEHIPDLHGALAQFHRLLRPNGRVYLEVPDASRYDPSLDAPFQEFSIEHINFFSPTSLANLMHTHGFPSVETGLKVSPQREVSCPATYGVFEKTGQSRPWDFDASTEAGLRLYIAGCGGEDRRIRGKIRESLSPDERMIVWGTGTHTLRLLATGGLVPDRIAAFVDSNAKYQNQELCGIPVVSPQEIRGRTEPILVSSRSCQNAIHRQIRDEMVLPNRVILLY